MIDGFSDLCHHVSNYKNGKAYVQCGYGFTQFKRVSNVYKTRNQTFECDYYHNGSIHGRLVTKKVVLAKVFCVVFFILID